MKLTLEVSHCGVLHRKGMWFSAISPSKLITPTPFGVGVIYPGLCWGICDIFQFESYYKNVAPFCSVTFLVAEHFCYFIKNKCIYLVILFIVFKTN